MKKQRDFLNLTMRFALSITKARGNRDTGTRSCPHTYNTVVQCKHLFQILIFTPNFKFTHNRTEILILTAKFTLIINNARDPREMNARLPAYI